MTFSFAPTLQFDEQEKKTLCNFGHLMSDFVEEAYNKKINCAFCPFQDICDEVAYESSLLSGCVRLKGLGEALVQFFRS